MPLSAPVGRTPKHERTLVCSGYLRGDGYWDIEGRLVDIKSYVVENIWRGTVEPGQPLHEMAIRLTVDENLNIVEAEAAIDASPFRQCTDVGPAFSCLKGLRIGSGWMADVRGLLGGVKGCTHLVEMLAPMASAAFQTVLAGRNMRARELPVRPRLLNTCHTYEESGEPPKMLWPGYFTAVAEGRDIPPVFAETTPPRRSDAMENYSAASRLAARTLGGKVACGGSSADDIHVAGVVGLGTMGRGIAIALAEAGMTVRVLDSDEGRIAVGIDFIRSRMDDQIRRGRLGREAAEAWLARIRPAKSLDEFKDVDIAIEAVHEDPAIKRGILASLDRCTKDGAILASNTSTLDVDSLAQATTRPADVIGTHFFVPAEVTPLLEVVQGAATSEAVVVRILALAERLGKAPVVARVCDGFIGNRMFDQYLRQAMLLIEQGAYPWDIDDALEKWGMAIGPFRSLDLIGNDIPWGVRKQRAQRSDPGFQPRIGDLICEKGWYGRKTGRGWYLHEGPNAGKRAPNPDLQRLIETRWADAAGVFNPPDPPTIVARCVMALVNEGARLLGDGIAARGSDVDVVMTMGYGFPIGRGGPLSVADAVGLDQVVRVAEAFARTDGGRDSAFWEPAPLLRNLARRRDALTRYER